MQAGRLSLIAQLAACLVAGMPGQGLAQLRDHLQCYSVKDPLALRGVVDVDTPKGFHEGCKLGKARFYCEPAAKAVRSSNRPILPVRGRGLLDSRICYTLRCANEAAVGFSGAVDQFGTHLSVSTPHPRLLCVPAVFGPPAAPMDDLDDVLCYRATETLFSLRGVVDADTRNLGVKAGCRIGRSRFFCAAARTTLQSVNVGPLLPIEGRGSDHDRTCYRVACPRPDPGPRVVSDRFGSRTETNLVPRVLCAPAPGPTTTTTTIVTATTTTTTFPPGTDPALICQRAIEAGGMTYALAWLDLLKTCAGPPATITIAHCTQTLAVTQIQNQWRADAEAACAGIDLRTGLGYAESCVACTVTDISDLITDLGGEIAGHLLRAARVIYAEQDVTTSCQDALGNGALDVLRSTLLDVRACVWQPGATSVADCYTPDASAWRTQAETACAGVDPFVSLGYDRTCGHNGATPVHPVYPGTCAPDAFPCTFSLTRLSNAAGLADDVLDCATCQLGDGVLGAARDLFGANLCCIGGTCNQVRTRFACREAGGTPVRYRIDSLPGVATGNAHGIDVGPDGALYMTGPGSAVTRVALPSATQTTVGATPFFATGVAVDPAGNVYVTNRCGHSINRIPPGDGAAVVIAGTGVPGHSGDGGPAIAAQVWAPDGIAVDPAGNVYFTESGLLGFACGGAGGGGSERVRMIDTGGVIHTIAGGGSGPSGGPALGAALLIPYGLRRAPDGSLVLGEVGTQRVLRIAGGLLQHVAGKSITPFGYHSGYGGPAAGATFYQNCGVAQDPDGNVIIGPMEDNRVALVDPGGSVIAIAGSGRGTFSSPYGDGGPALLAEVGCPEDVAVGPDGTIYVSDLMTGRIRVLTREPF